MAWQCPYCGRSFKNRNQAHSCVRTNIDDLFAGKSPVVYSLFEKLREEVKKSGPVKIHASKSAINFSVENTFMTAKPKTNWLDIEFLMDEEINELPVNKAVKAYKAKWALFVRIESEGDFTKKLIDLLKRSYKLSK